MEPSNLGFGPGCYHIGYREGLLGKYTITGRKRMAYEDLRWPYHLHVRP